MPRAAPTPAVVLGEVLCDLFGPEPGVPLAEAAALVPRPGGAPANVAVQLARLGCAVELLSAVGDDPLGARVLTELEREGVGVRYVQRRADRRTGLTLVEVDAAGERSFCPWRERSADQSFSERDLPPSLLDETPLLHRGTVTLRSEPARTATRAAVERARLAGAIISLDVNLRFRMFPSAEKLCALARGAVRGAHVVKATRQEAEALYGARPTDALVDRLHASGARLVLLTFDVDGALLSSHRARVQVPAPAVPVVDATGAGDAFMGALLAELLRRDLGPEDLSTLDDAALEDLGGKACWAGAQAVTALGATTGMVRSLAGAATSRPCRTPSDPLPS